MIYYDANIFGYLWSDRKELRLIGQGIISAMDKERFSEVLEHYLQLRSTHQFRKSVTDVFWFKALEFELHYRLEI